jgi:hypothetical protein
VRNVVSENLHAACTSMSLLPVIETDFYTLPFLFESYICVDFIEGLPCARGECTRYRSDQIR